MTHGSSGAAANVSVQWGCKGEGAVTAEDLDTGTEVIAGILDRFDTPVQRVRLACVSIDLRDTGRLERECRRLGDHRPGQPLAKP